MRIELSAFNELTHKILGSAIEVHRVLGPGLLESTYMPCLHYELSSRNVKFVTEQKIPIVYKGLKLASSYRIDLIVEESVIVEVKSVATLAPVFEAQLLTYMHLRPCPLGLLINFNVPRLMDGVRRLVNPRAGTTEPTEPTEETGSTNGGTE